ncbi:Asp-tRNA(Asn)/Glu-tRNA(Gln) amidotransferase A subunit family amidase [Nocardiopsis terrae]|uniref:Asp-tRNA(Asn)/Glu-tRNA(Gln) amidotransferase A subunit family amidase n=1 Tax=Nocardiopsis terrae TaxID=372655 RepID=A0ABR9HD57_9ACTN|nr:Asp-tRNA(Asn)/Glu-tRNA(Gln) amidotransferase A subunit family amidase [Nocardiopsis terrae]
MSPTRDTVGVMARDVDDIKVLDAVLSGHVLPSAPPPSPAQRVLVLPRATTWTDLDPEVARVVEGACDALRAAGWSLRDFPEPLYDTAELLDVATSVPLAETRAAVEDYLRGHDSPHTFDTVIEGLASPDVRAILMPLLDGPAITPDLYHSALRTGARMASRALSALESAGAAAFLSPTTITAAPPLGTGWSMLRAGRPVPVFSTYIRNTAPSAVWGWPSLTLPAGYTSRGWPVGILLDAPPRHDRRLLDLGRLCARDLSMASLPGSPCTP